MESILADLINSKRVPKIIRYLIVIITVVLIMLLGLFAGFASEMLVGNIVGFALAIAGLVAGIYMIRKIHKN